MQIYGLRTRYSAALKKAKIIERPELTRTEESPPSPRRGHRPEAAVQAPAVSRYGLSALLTPDDPALHRQVSHQAGVSYSDEARIANQISELRRALTDIRSLQNMSTQLGPAVYA